MKSNHYLFVYGTLRRDTKTEMYHLLARHADFVADATFRGKLFLVDYYPGVVPSDEDRDVVHGEVYQLRDAESVLAKIDQYEECGDGFPQPTEYVRVIAPIRLANGKTVNAWVYVYNRSTQGLTKIASGDFLRIEQEKG